MYMYVQHKFESTRYPQGINMYIEKYIHMHT